MPTRSSRSRPQSRRRSRRAKRCAIRAATYHPTPVADLAKLGAAHPVDRRTSPPTRRRRSRSSTSPIPRLRHGVRRADRIDAALDLEGVPALQGRRLVRVRAAQALRRRELRFPQHDADRREGTAAARAALHRRHRRVAARRARQGYVEKAFPPAAKARAQGARRQPAGRPARRHRDARLDERRHQGARGREAGRVHQEDRLPRQVGRLLEAHRHRRTVREQRHRGAPLPERAQHRAHRNRDGPHALRHDAADRQRVLQPVRQRDRVSGRHPAAAVLQRERRRRGELRRDRRRDRSRDDARLRRPGPPVRREGQPERLVDAGRRGRVQEARAVHRRRVQLRSNRSRACTRTAPTSRARRSPTSAV